MTSTMRSRSTPWTVGMGARSESSAPSRARRADAKSTASPTGSGRIPRRRSTSLDPSSRVNVGAPSPAELSAWRSRARSIAGNLRGLAVHAAFTPLDSRARADSIGRSSDTAASPRSRASPTRGGVASIIAIAKRTSAARADSAKPVSSLVESSRPLSTPTAPSVNVRCDKACAGSSVTSGATASSISAAARAQSTARSASEQNTVSGCVRRSSRVSRLAGEGVSDLVRRGSLQRIAHGARVERFPCHDAHARRAARQLPSPRESPQPVCVVHDVPW